MMLWTWWSMRYWHMIRKDYNDAEHGYLWDTYILCKRLPKDEAGNDLSVETAMKMCHHFRENYLAWFG